MSSLLRKLDVADRRALAELALSLAAGTGGDAGPAAIAAESASPIRYTQSDDLNIAYQVTGAGDVDLVLVAGFVSHLMLDWTERRHAHFLHRLGTFSRLIRFDKRGTGMSDRPDGLPDLETRMGDVMAVMDAAGRERAVLFGYSEGGPMSILYAASHPERVHGLVIYSSYARRLWAPDYPWGFRPDERARYAAQLEQDWAWEADMRRMCPNADEELARWWGERCRAADSPGAARALDRDGLPDRRAGRARRRAGADARAAPPRRHRLTRRGGSLPRRAHPRRAVRRARRQRSLRRASIRTRSSTRSRSSFAAWGPPRRPRRRSPRSSPSTSRSPSTRPGCAASCAECSRSTGECRPSPSRATVLATFDGPGRAVRCGLALTDRAAAANLHLSVGLHTAEIARRGAMSPATASPSPRRSPIALRRARCGRPRPLRDLTADSALSFEPREQLDVPALGRQVQLVAATDHERRHA